MKKVFKLSLILSALILSSCNKGVSSSTNEEKENTSGVVAPSETTPSKETSTLESSKETSSSQTSEISSSNATSEESTSSSSSSEESTPTPAEAEKVSLEEAKNACLSFEGTPNEAGLVIGERLFEVQGLVISVFDFGKSTKAYNGTEKYKATITDGTSFLTVALNEQFYKKVKDYIGQETTFYKIVGKESRLNGKAELIATSFEFLSGTTTRYSSEQLLSIAPNSASINDSYSRLSKAPLNAAGNYDGEIRSIKLKFVEKVVDSVWLFTDGVNYVTLHGPSKAYNNFKATTKAINVLVQENMYKYALSFDYITHVSLNEDITIPNAKEGIKEVDLYKNYPTKDSTSHFKVYEERKMNVYSFEGYVDYYVKTNKIFFVLSSTLNVLESTNRTKENARSKQTLFVSNETESNLTLSDSKYSKLYEAWQKEEKVNITIYPYAWNSEKYFQVHVYFK